MAAYLEIEPADRPINMLGQPLIRLYTSGGPGEALGDFRRPPMANGMGCCGSMPSMADLGCCGARRRRSSGMGQVATAVAVGQAKALKNHCDKLDDAVKAITDQAAKVQASNKLSSDQKAALVNGLKNQLKALKKTFRKCFWQLHELVRTNRKGLTSDVVGAVDRRVQTIKNRAALARLNGKQG